MFLNICFQESVELYESLSKLQIVITGDPRDTTAFGTKKCPKTRRKSNICEYKVHNQSWRVKIYDIVYFI